MTIFSKKISIVTINYNNVNGLIKTINSVVSQTFIDFEFIIIDGGSLDGSKEEIEKYNSKINYWSSEKDEGVYDAMNKGISKASGEYCYFLNSGDFLLNKDVLKNVFSMPCQSDIIYGNMVPEGHTRIEYGIDELSFYNFFVGSIYHQAAFIKRELFYKIGFYKMEYKVVADWEFFLDAIFLNNCTTKYINLEIASYELGGLSFQNTASNLEDRKIILQKKFPLFIKDYNELLKTNHSPLIGLHSFIENNKMANKTIMILLHFYRFFKFSFVKKRLSS